MRTHRHAIIIWATPYTDIPFIYHFICGAAMCEDNQRKTSTSSRTHTRCDALNVAICIGTCAHNFDQFNSNSPQKYTSQFSMLLFRTMFGWRMIIIITIIISMIIAIILISVLYHLPLTLLVLYTIYVWSFRTVQPTLKDCLTITRFSTYILHNNIR